MGMYEKLTNLRCSWCNRKYEGPLESGMLVVCPDCGTAGLTCDEWRAESEKRYEEARLRVEAGA